MAVHHGLNLVVALLHAERERAVVVGLQDFALGVVHLAAVHQEVGTLHGDARAVVHHVAREAAAVGNDELMHRLVVAMGVEGHRVVVHLVFDASLSDGGHLVVGRLTAVVRQFVGLEEAALVGHDIPYKRLLVAHDMVDGYADVGSARAVVEAYVAFHAAGVLTLAHLHLCLGRGDAFAVVHGQHLIFVCNQRRHGLVLVAHLVQVGGHFLPSIVVLALHAAHHLEVVDGVAVGVPGQQHAALARRRHQRRLNRTRVLVVEVEVVTIARSLTGHHGHSLAVDKLPGAVLLGVHQADHLVLVGHIVYNHITPGVLSNSECACVIFAPRTPTATSCVDAIEHRFSIGQALVIDTVELPFAFATPSDDFTGKRII